MRLFVLTHQYSAGLDPPSSVQKHQVEAGEAALYSSLALDLPFSPAHSASVLESMLE